MTAIASTQPSRINAHGIDIAALKELLRDKSKKVTVMVKGSNEEPPRQARVFFAENGWLCEFKPRSKSRGYYLDEDAVVAVTSKAKPTTEERRTALVEKYRRLASKATFKNKFIEACLAGDPSKSLHENGITTGNRIDGKCISVERVMRYIGGGAAERLVNAIQKKQTGYHSGVFNMDGFDCRVETYSYSGEFACSLSVEFRGCANGYYYLLINDDTFIGYDVD